MRSSLVSCIAVLALACGSKPAEAPDQPVESEQASAETPEQDPEAEAEVTPEEAQGEGEKPAGGKPERTVKYVMGSGGGFDVEVEDVRFTPKATAVKSGAGWGVKLVVEVKVLDDNAHSLLDPKNGPLAFAGTVERGGQTSRIIDKREGEGEKLIAAGDKVKLERAWPGKGGEKPLTAGDSLALEVGLWGLGPDADQRRPVRAFFQVKLKVDKGKPQAVVSPPPTESL